MAVLFLEGVFYYHFTTPEFNDNVLQIPLWALTAYCYYLAVSNQRLRDWMGAGLFLGLALLAKYFAVMLFIPMAVLLFATEPGRRSFKKPGFYLGLSVASLVFLPNLLWQISHNWQYIHYAMDRAVVVPSWFNHVRYPLKFLLSQLLALSPALILLLWGANARFTHTPKDRFTTHYLMIMSLGPFLTVLMYSAVTGTQVRSMWGTPLFSLIGVLLVYLSQPDVKTLPRLLMCYATYFVIALFSYVLMVTVSPYFLGYAKNEFYPSQAIALETTRLWHQHTQQPLAFVLGSRRLTARVAVYSADHPTPYFDLNPATSPWVDEARLSQQGAMILWDVHKWGPDLPKNIKSRYPHARKLQAHPFAWQTGAAHLRPVVIGMAFLPPKG